MSDIEICAVCHGLKKIDGFLAKEADLRAALYNRASIIAKNIAALAVSLTYVFYIYIRTTLPFYIHT
jgi:hypothetical protein